MTSDKPIPYTPLTGAEAVELRYARTLLENPGFAARMANVLGTPIEVGFKLLPKDFNKALNKAVHMALERGLDAALLTLGRSPRKASELLHKTVVGASGAIGGVFGVAALAVELPVSTVIMLRSIADIARSEGHDIHDMEVRLNCMEVFALGGRSAKDDAAESAYWAVRGAFAKMIPEAAAALTKRGASRVSAPAVTRMISSIASRFGVVVSEEMAAKAVPILGAAAGAVVNVLFMDHFQDMARGHFIVKRLEKKYGRGAIESAYNFLK
jgi:hypothetical protein